MSWRSLILGIMLPRICFVQETFQKLACWNTADHIKVKQQTSKNLQAANSLQDDSEIGELPKQLVGLVFEAASDQRSNSLADERKDVLFVLPRLVCSSLREATRRLHWDRACVAMLVEGSVFHLMMGPAQESCLRCTVLLRQALAAAKRLEEQGHAATLLHQQQPFLHGCVY